jgi:U1 small nuclear ribonucleoprotein
LSHLPCDHDKHGCIQEAYKTADGRKIEGRRILVDVERGRTVETWWAEGDQGVAGGGAGEDEDDSSVLKHRLGMLANSSGMLASVAQHAVMLFPLSRRPRRLGGGLGGEGRLPKPPKKPKAGMAAVVAAVTGGGLDDRRGPPGPPFPPPPGVDRDRERYRERSPPR